MAKTNIDAERAVIGAIVARPEAIWEAAEFIKAEAFSDPTLRQIWSTLEHFAQEGDLIRDQIHLIAAAKELGFEVSTTELLRACEYTFSANIKTHAKIVGDLGREREVEHTLDLSRQKLSEGTESVEEVLTDLESDLRAIEAGRAAHGASSASNIMTEVLSQVDVVAQNADTVLGVDTGIGQINDLTGGLMPSDLYVLAARPGMGKTALALSIAYQASSDVPVLFFSMEMSALQLGQRLVSMVSQVPLVKIRTGRMPSPHMEGQYIPLSQSEIESVTQAATEVANTPIHIDDTAMLTPATMRASIERVKRQHGLGMVVVDYLQLISGAPRQSDVERVSEASRWCKLLAKEFDVPVLALSQLNRSCEERHNKRPLLSDLRQSGAIEQDADAVFFLYRPAAYGEQGTAGEDLTRVAELIVGKQRNGPLGTVPIRWEPESATFSTFRGI